MGLLHDLIHKIDDPALKNRIQSEIERLLKKKKFGLVFEEHLPECVILYGIPIHIGTKVAPKTGYVSDIYTVVQIENGKAICNHTSTHESVQFCIDELVAIAEFGEPIYPSLKKIATVEKAQDSDLWHTLIEADNYHALQLLEYLYPEKVDCIYIDPPYNTGAKDWKYNNDYVDVKDAYRHSKWLSMMEKRLKIAKKLLNPNDSVLIVTIDEKEYLHLGCLLEQIFPYARIQMVSSVVNPSGVSRSDEFYRTDEYLFFVKVGSASPTPLLLSDEWITARSTGKDKLRWRPIRRQGADDTRKDAPNQFYPIYISTDGKHFAGTGESLPLEADRNSWKLPRDKIAIWPLKPDGTEGRWQISQDTFDRLCREGFTRISYTKKWGYVPQYLAEGERKKIKNGQFSILGHNEDGSILTDEAQEEAPFIPGTQWRIHAHSAREFGSALINGIFKDKRFSFPKSLYAVRDTIRFFVANKPNALILDFFAGSGTTLQAVNLLNADDGGQRRCIMVTNNEVSADEAKFLATQGYQPGDEEWEKLGIARYVTWPRTVCSIEGHDINGNPLKGNYLDTDKPMAHGLKANAIFFKLHFLDKTSVALGRQFRALLPLLWMKSGAFGKCPELSYNELPTMMILPDNKFAVLLDEISYQHFDREISNHPEIETIFIVTDSETDYRKIIRYYDDKQCFQLYRDYLDNFRINAGDRP